MLDININSIDIINEKDEEPILSNINFSLDPKNIYTVLGKNGTGKTTLVLALTNLLDQGSHKVAGEVFFENVNLLDLDEEKIRSIRQTKIKYVFQDSINSFNPLKKFEYYFKILTVTDQEIDQLLEYFLLPNKAEIYKKYPYEVSGGMAQRINFILALLAKPKLLILDEPTSALDVAIGNLVNLKLKEYVTSQESSVFIITQDFQFAMEVSDYVSELESGRLSSFINVKKFKTSSLAASYSSFKNLTR